MQADSPETLELLSRVRGGDAEAMEELIARHRPLLRRFVELRLDPRLQGRLDASDVVQEAQLEVARRMHEFLERQPMPFCLWLHRTAYENLLRLRRKHLAADCRSVRREVALPDSSSVLLIQRLFPRDAWPGQRLVEEELRRRVGAAIGKLDDIDREILQLRAFEGLDNDEAAQVLDLEPGTASKRFGRALLRLRKELLRSGEAEREP